MNNFPANPDLNDLFELDGRSWKFNGETWDILSITDALVERAETAAVTALKTLATESETPPEDPIPGQEWIHSDGTKYTWLETEGVWAEIGTIQLVDNVNLVDDLRNHLASGLSNKGAGAVGFVFSSTYAVNTVGRWLQDLGTSVGATFMKYVNTGLTAIARTVQDRLRDTVNAADYGAHPDNADNYTFIMNALAEHKHVRLNPGVFLLSQGIRLASNRRLTGSGIDLTELALTDAAADGEHVVTNEQNTGSYLTNTGNTNIHISHMTLNGNGRRSTPGSAGCSLQLAFVSHSRVSHVKGTNGRLHCIDVSASQYEIGVDPEQYTPGASFDVVLDNVIGVDPVNDDAITVHYSNNITLINPQAIATGDHEINWTSQGVEIDDGCYDIKIFGGYSKGFTKGLQIKGHQTNPAATRVTVDSFTSEGCVYSFEVAHGDWDEPASATAFDVVLSKCVSLRPVFVNDHYDELRALQIQNYANVAVRDFTVIGDPAVAGNATTGNGVIHVTIGARNVELDGVSFRGVNAQTGSGIIRVVSTTDENVRVRRVRAIDCTGNVLYATSSAGIKVDGIHAEQYGVDIDGVVKLSNGAVNSSGTCIENITGVGYLQAVIDEDGVAESIAMPLGRANSIGVKSYWRRGNSSGNVSAGPQRGISIGIMTGFQNQGIGEGTRYDFLFRRKNDSVYEVASIASYKATSIDTESSYAMRFGTRNTADAGTSFTYRLQLDQSGHLDPLTDELQNLGSSTLSWLNGYIKQIRPGAGTAIWTSGSGSPEGVIVADIGSMFTRTDGGASTTLYIKESGDGINTGWVAK